MTNPTSDARLQPPTDEPRTELRGNRHSVSRAGPQPCATTTSAARLPADAAAGIAQLDAHYRRYYGSYWKQALTMVGSAEAAHDVVQEAFTTTAEKIHDGVVIEHFGAWMRTVVRNQCTHHWRQHRVVPLEEEPEIVGGVSAAATAEARDRCHDVFCAAGELPPTQQSAFLLAEVKGLNYREIAESLGRSENSVRQLLSRARKFVRETAVHDGLGVLVPAMRLGARAAGNLHRRVSEARRLATYKLAELQTSFTSLLQRAGDALEKQLLPVLAGVALTVAVVGVVGVPAGLLPLGPGTHRGDGGPPSPQTGPHGLDGWLGAPGTPVAGGLLPGTGTWSEPGRPAHQRAGDDQTTKPATGANFPGSDGRATGANGPHDGNAPGSGAADACAPNCNAPGNGPQPRKRPRHDRGPAPRPDGGSAPRPDRGGQPESPADNDRLDANGPAIPPTPAASGDNEPADNGPVGDESGANEPPGNEPSGNGSSTDPADQPPTGQNPGGDGNGGRGPGGRTAGGDAPMG